jgi:hypothetical protein
MERLSDVRLNDDRVREIASYEAKDDAPWPHESRLLAREVLAARLSRSTVEPEGAAPGDADEALAVAISWKMKEAEAAGDRLAFVCWLNALARLPEAPVVPSEQGGANG